MTRKRKQATAVITCVAAAAVAAVLLLSSGPEPEPTGVAADSGARTNGDRPPAAHAEGGRDSGGNRAKSKPGKDPDRSHARPEGARERRSAQGTISSPQAGTEPTSACGPSQSVGSRSVPSPPVPSLSALPRGDQILVNYRFLALPSDCRPAAILVTVNSKNNLALVSGVGGTPRTVPVRAAAGTLVIRPPEGGSPPYEARAQSFSRPGARSAQAIVPVR